jgi:hypothetical protein
MGLSFLTPMLLGGAALVAVPLVLHLIMRRKPVPHEFPALRFLREQAVANRRRLRLSHLFLLFLRMAALALVAVALARPVIRGAGWLADGEAPVAAAFVFDTAPRMLLREANRTRLQQAAALAKVLFAKLPDGSRVAVLDTGGGPAAFSPTVAEAEARIDRLAAATPAVSLPAAITAARRLLEGAELARRELYVFSDCSHGAWDGAAPHDAAAPAALVVDVSAAAPDDFAIASLEMSEERVAAGTPVGLSATLARTGPDSSRPVAVELLMPDGRYARRAVKPVEWRQAAPAQVDFELTGLEPGTRQGRLVIDGADDLEADDVRFFTVAVGAPAGVIVAAPAPAARTGRFVAEALAPAALRRAGTARFEPQLVDVAALDTTPWDAARGIVLVDPPPLDSKVWETLGEWVSRGRGLVVWLGPRAGSAAGFDTVAARRVLGGRPVRVWRSPRGDNYLAPQSLDHPLLAAFRRVGDAVPWQDFPVTRHWEFVPEPTGDAAAVVATFRNGLPAVLERRLGLGTVVVVTTPASQAASDPEAWNTLATGFEPWPFVMLATETLLHAIDTVQACNVVAGRPAVVRVDRRDVATAYVRTPSGDEFPAPVDRTSGAVTVTATQQPGNYAVRVGGGAEGAVGFSANLDRSAIDFTRAAPDELAAVLGADTRLARTEADLVRDVDLERIGVELFGWAIVLAALAMAADWIVANRFYAPREDQPAGRPAAAVDAAPPEQPPLPPPVPRAPASPAVPPPVPPAVAPVRP